MVDHFSKAVHFIPLVKLPSQKTTHFLVQCLPSPWYSSRHSLVTGSPDPHLLPRSGRCFAKHWGPLPAFPLVITLRLMASWCFQIRSWSLPCSAWQLIYRPAGHPTCPGFGTSQLPGQLCKRYVPSHGHPGFLASTITLAGNGSSHSMGLHSVKAHLGHAC